MNAGRWCSPARLPDDRRHRHRLDLDVGERLISVDLQEHVADAQGRALVMGDDDLDLFHEIASGCFALTWHSDVIAKRDVDRSVNAGLTVEGRRALVFEGCRPRLWMR